MEHDRDREAKALFDFAGREVRQRPTKSRVKAPMDRTEEVVYQLGSNIGWQTEEKRAQRGSAGIGMPQDRPQVGVENAFEIGFAIAQHVIEQQQAFLIQGRDPSIEQGAQQNLLGAEVIVNSRRIHSCLACHGSDRGRVEALARKELLGGVENQSCRIGVGHRLLDTTGERIIQSSVWHRETGGAALGTGAVAFEA